MRRWVVPLLLIMVVGGLLLVRLARPTTHSQPSDSIVHDPDALAVEEDAMKVMGYEGKAFSGHNWRAASCDSYTYLVQPTVEGADPFLFVKSLKTGEMRFLKAAELDQALKRHVSYDGRFLGVPRGMGDANEYYSLGSMDRNGDRVFVYVGFDETACGLVADEVWYWAPRVNEKVKLKVRLLP